MTTKDTNNYRVHTEYDAKSGKAQVAFVKNDRVVNFEELPETEKDIYRCMIGEIVNIVFPPCEGVQVEDMGDESEVE